MTSKREENERDKVRELESSSEAVTTQTPNPRTELLVSLQLRLKESLVKKLEKVGDEMKTTLSCSKSDNYPPPDCVLEGKFVSGKLLVDHYQEFITHHLANMHTAEGTLYKISQLIADEGNVNKENTKDIYLLQDILRYLAQPQPQTPSDIEEAQVFFHHSYAPGFFGLFASTKMEKHGKTLKDFLEDPSVRLVVTPSYGRTDPSKTYLRSKASDIWGPQRTLHVLLVRPFERRLYVNKFCPRGFVIVSMPENEEGIGSARFWCVELARVLNRKWFFMIDDSLMEHSKCIKLRVNGPEKTLAFPLREAVSLLEALTQDLTSEQCDKIGIVALRRFSGQNMNKQDITIHFCQGLQLIHREAVNKKRCFLPPWPSLP